MGKWKPIHLEQENLQFSIFTTEDVKKLSVTKVMTGLTFDVLGRPLPGGLYDPLMGTYARSTDPCTTCLLFSNCPGHLGHIELQSLVYNPFFYKMIYDILKLSCLYCFKMQFTDHTEKIQILQFELFNAGYVLEAKNIAIYKSEMTAAESNVKIMKTEFGESVHPKIAEMQELLSKGPSENVVETKTSCAIRSDIIRDILQSTPTSKKCIFCQKYYRKVRYSYKKLVIPLTKEDKEQLIEQKADQIKGNKVILADECRDYLREIYKNHSKLLQELFPMLKTCSGNVEYPTDVIFMDVIPVTPPKSRPISILNNEITEHPQTITYRNIITVNSVLRLIVENIKKRGEDLKDEAKVVYENARGSTSYEKIYYAWQELQKTVDILLDSSIERNRNDLQGLKQLLEKKDGLIRKHMMGKRVNYAARTVITPDPNINVEEVGIPEIFARKLSYPVPVTPWNIATLRKMVMNGPNIHPGANYIVDEKGTKILIPSDNPAKRESYAKLLLTKPENGIKIVHRHLLNGDILLLNRQPTLHKPSIMAHKARILKDEKTFRLHYSNCKAYNADFDGDEMNAHFPQNEIARSEAYNIVNVANQYLVPKDGTPLGGLIQDHVISGVKLSLRGRFFNREDYQKLVYQGLSHIRGDIKLLPPTILKPFKLWSGKQILSTLIINIIPKGYPLINLTSSAKVNAKHWQVEPSQNWTAGGTLRGNDMSESEVIILEGELIAGVLDKEQYGATKFGLIHCMYELYGGECSTQLLTAFTKLFTSFLQREGFTLGVQDILVTSRADHKRRKIIRECRKAGNEIAATALNLDEVPPPDILAEKLEEAYVKNPKYRLILDRYYKSVLDKYTNEINQTCLPGGLISKFPQNNLQLMVLSGAKGSMVNTMQISCLLGQIELEGKRPPLMISGKSLPSFATFETSPKSGGFIDGRFMTGIQPQDFFFHCMAGREGLIDTAVKTSRSGYLQRCLIKHLEGLSVGYDLTVRDSDNSVVQFLYGEDGLDISKSKFFNQKALKFLDDNTKVILHHRQLELIKNEEIFAKIQKHLKKLRSWKKKNGNPQQTLRSSAFQKFSAEIRDEIEVKNAEKLVPGFGRLNLNQKITELWLNANDEKKKSYQKKYARCPEPVTSIYKPDNFYGAISEYLEELMENYVKVYPDRKTEIKDVVYLKAMQAIAQPGEPVGLLAAQSIGEPSTQMTLNTFHFAGRGEMNVTLGIPRLREILMLASVNIKTPSMDIPFKQNQVKNAEKLRIKLNRVVLADVLEYINVKFKLVVRPERVYVYTIYFKFLPRDAYSEEFNVKPKQILKYMTNVFIKAMFKAMLRSAKSKCTIVDVEEKTSKADKVDECNREEDDDNGVGTEMNKRTETDKSVDIIDSSDDESGEANDDDDATGIKLKSRKHDENEYDDPEVDEEVQDANENDEVEENELNEYDKSTDDIDDDIQSESVVNNDMVNDYRYDKENYLWCELTFRLPMRYKNLDISSILKGLAHKSVIYQVPNIKRAITYKHNDDLILKTEGINIAQMFSYDKYLDLNRLYSNDIHAIAKIYGIEAAARVIVKEVKNVFKVYGIEVDSRHLLMIADYMTFEGIFKPLSRKGMEHSASPLQQMSFESCLQFLKSTVFYGRKDNLLSPSSRLMVGLPVKTGTGTFSLEAKIG